MRPIDSIKHPVIVAARALSTRHGRTTAGRCLVEGPTLIRQVLEAGTKPVHVLCSDDADDPDLRQELLDAGVDVYPVRAGLLRKITGGARPVGWLAVAALPAEVTGPEPYGDFAVVCEQIADPGNLGTIVRTAGALGVRDIVLTDDTADLSSRRVLDAARGAVLGCRVHRFADPVSAVEALRERGFQVVATSPRGQYLQALAPMSGRPVALVVGNETEGVGAATLAAADLVVQIPMAGAVESLNVGVAAGVGMYELRTRMVMSVLTDRIRHTLGRNLGVTAQMARQVFDDQLRQVGDLDGTQAILLMVLACERRTPLAQLRRDTGSDTEELQAAMAPLRERGYVVQERDLAEITGEGERAVAALWMAQDRAEETLYAGFTREERAQLHSLLERVRSNASGGAP